MIRHLVQTEKGNFYAVTSDLQVLLDEGDGPQSVSFGSDSLFKLAERLPVHKFTVSDRNGDINGVWTSAIADVLLYELALGRLPQAIRTFYGMSLFHLYSVTFNVYGERIELTRYGALKTDRTYEPESGIRDVMEVINELRDEL